MAYCTKKVLNYGVKASCREQASEVFMFSNGARVARCKGHAGEPIKTKHKKISSGDPCPICQCGFIERYKHIDKGKCYRCQGKGHW